MSENFFLDNPDLQFRLEQLEIEDVLELKEKGYQYHTEYAAAPRHYADAKDNYRLLLEVLGEICARVIAPRAAEADLEGAHYENGQVTYAEATQEGLLALKQADLMGAMLPWEYGGLNLPESIFQMMVEIVSRADASLMTVFGLQEISAAINEYGTPEMKARLLPRFSQEGASGAMILTEPDAGSDLGAVRTSASYDEVSGKWYIDGVKRFATNGCADIALVLARSEPGSTDARGLSLFVVVRDETVRIRRIENKLGIHASPTCEVQYNHTPAELLGKRRYGLMRYAMNLMNGARLAVGAQAVGIAEAAYREAYHYAAERHQFNRPVCEIPPVKRLLNSMRGEIEAARALTTETAKWVDLTKVYEQLSEANPDPALKQKLRQASSLAETLTPLTKYYASEMGNRVCYQAMQVHGGVGYMREFNVERHFRDVRVTNIYEGTSQLQIVAATGKLLGHALDGLLDEWAGLDYGAPLAGLKSQLVEETAQFKQATDVLKSCDRDVIDYYASDLADMAVYLVNMWLLLKDGRVSEQKKEFAGWYTHEHLTHIRNAMQLILDAGHEFSKEPSLTSTA
ncbi:MAG TPA: acyl-CoA dehydrogenase family protein [Anaerolineales bacterium]|nr:acyl-CoA dehydrogenase family protein [Anaerolineales bacterium]